MAEGFNAWGQARDAQLGRGPKGHLVFAPAKYLSHRQLKTMAWTTRPLPFALFREA